MTIKRKFSRLLYLFVALATVIPILAAGQASALQLTARDVVIGSSLASASTSFQFDLTTGSTATIQSFSAQACTTASGACTSAPGFSASSSTFTSSTFSGSWTVNTGTADTLKATSTGSSSTPASTAKNIIFGSVVNPSAPNSTYFLRLTTYSDNAYTTPVDTGVVASSTAGQITVTASVDETLTFTLSSATVGLGTLTTSTTGSGTSTMTAATNATTGYSVTVNGTTLTSGANTITALASQTASTQGSSQFGINLKANTTPSIGSNVSGSGSGTATANYNTADSFRFVTGDPVASAAGPTNSNTYTVSYIGNIAGVTKPGSYSTVLTYIATATF